MKDFYLLFKYVVLTIAFAFTYHHAQSQMTISIPMLSNPIDSMVANYLAGDAVEVLSVSYLGSNSAVGTFSYPESWFPFEEGMILSSGKIFQAPNIAAFLATTNFGISTPYPDLAALTTGPIRDPAILEITFIPFTDTLVFDWILGSEEFPTYVGSVFNDVFGFFLEGPGINGMFSNNAVNLATLPNGNTATINNIFSSSSGFFYNNINGPAPVYNGYSIPMQAIAVVQPFQTYTIRIAVADVVDYILDTAIFLKAGSLNVIYEFLTADGFQENATDEMAADGSISLNIQGGIPPYSILWNTGDTTAVLTDLSPGVYTVTITDYINQEVNLEFFLFEPLETISQWEDVTCFGESNGAIELNISGGLGTHDILWSTGATSSAITGLSGGLYSATITDQSGIPHIEQFEIYEPEILTATIEITDALNSYNGSIIPQVSGGTEPYFFSWSNGATVETKTYLGPGVYELTITDANGCVFESSTIEIGFSYGDIEISGAIYHFHDLSTGINAAGLNADNFQFLSGTDGTFNFEVPYHEAGVFVQPEKDDDYLNGLTTFDAVLITRHILGVQTLPTVYHKIAADINANGQIEIGDVIQLRNLILMLDTDFVDPFTGEKNNTSWRFVPLAYDLQDTALASPMVPEFPEDVVVMADIDNNPVNLDFVGIKVGDVNGSANPEQFTAPGDSEDQYLHLRNNYIVSLPNLQVKKGERYEVPVSIPMLNQMAGFQFGLAWDSDFLNIKNATPENKSLLGQEHFNLNTDENYLLVSWNGNAEFADNEPLLLLEIEAKADGNLSEMLTAAQLHLRNEAYTHDLQHANLDITFTEGKPMADFTIYPNPASGDVQIILSQEENSIYQISLMDASGKLILQFENRELIAGEHTITIPAIHFPTAGVYFIRMESETVNGVQKLIYKP